MTEKHLYNCIDLASAEAFELLGSNALSIGALLKRPQSEVIPIKEEKLAGVSTNGIDAIIKPAIVKLRTSINAAYDHQTRQIDLAAFKEAFNDAAVSLNDGLEKSIPDKNTRSGLIMPLLVAETVLILHQRIPQRPRAARG
jgi:hypothetical protein